MSEKEVDDVSNVLEWKFCSFPSSLLFFLLVCIPPCAWCKSLLSELCGVFTRWHSIAFGAYKGVCSQAQSIHCTPSWRERPSMCSGCFSLGFQSQTRCCVPLSSSWFCSVLVVLPFGQEGWGRGSRWHSGGVSQHSGGLSWPRTVWWQQFCASDSSLRELALFQKGNIKPCSAVFTEQVFNMVFCSSYCLNCLFL